VSQLLNYPLVLLAHVNYCDDSELDLLSRGVASVAYCPRTHAYFGHPPHRWREMLAQGVNVCVGSDSRASSPDLNLVDDLRLMHRLAPEVPPATLWEMATLRGARALGMSVGWGTLTPGKFADCVALPATTEDPLREILEGSVLPLAVWADGREVLTGAR
jgi:cytosine/adenosine deaminase-related metal-dependent hydrolase